jgi:hypothetical protein
MGTPSESDPAARRGNGKEPTIYESVPATVRCPAWITAQAYDPPLPITLSRPHPAGQSIVVAWRGRRQERSTEPNHSNSDSMPSWAWESQQDEAEEQ